MKMVGHGYTWQDLEVGLKFRTHNRTITETDLVGFVNATGMLEMIFIDQTYEHAGGIKGGRVVPAALPYTLMEGLLCQTVQQMTGLALLEIEKKVLKPTFVGDTVHIEVEVLAIKPTSKGNRAVVTTRNDIVNQKGETVITYKAVRMMAGRVVVHSRRARSAPVRELVHRMNAIRQGPGSARLGLRPAALGRGRTRITSSRAGSGCRR